MEYTVKIEDVTFGYGDRLILQNVSMKFGAGKVVAIMGGSGMGKTTLLKLIGGLLTPQGGRVEVTGETLDPSNQKRLYRIRRRIAAMSVADEFHVHIFPEDFPVNIANPANNKVNKYLFIFCSFFD